ncbi:MAG: malto-oligosyltrehalose synthase [Elusimicrobia bacterium]|nr:malto-oligosyltrehalose synthase [Elusimicrobiota bacterium]
MTAVTAAGAREAARRILRAELAAAYMPASVYRLQLTPRTGFRRAAELTGYLRDLGIHALYFSPYFKTAAGSANGYAVTDPTALDPGLGSERDFDALCARLSEAGLGHVADIVPNHMGIAENPYWRDVLEHGRRSRFAGFFDIDWDPPKAALRGRILLPVLEDYFGKVLEEGLIRLVHADGRFSIAYRNLSFPLAPSSLSYLYERAGAVGPAASRRAARCLAAFNGRKGVPASFDLLEGLLDLQVYRLAHWRAASDEINYRRFFNFNDLAAVRSEKPEVFELFHRLVFRLLEEGKVQGLRIDHPDGLYDPPGYFARLQEGWLRRRLERAGIPPEEAAAALSEEEFREAAPLFVVAEKILDRREPLRDDWRVRGTVGYDFLNSLNGLFVDRAGEAAMDAAYEHFIGRRKDVAALVYAAKRLFLETYLAGEIEALGHRLSELAESNRAYRDFTKRSLTAAVREAIACFPVYRTYIAPRARFPSESDRRYIAAALARARGAAPDLGSGVFDLLEDVLLLRAEPRADPERRAAFRDFVLRFQQLTAPVMAKGLEDTAFYIDHRLVSLNEVGGDPRRFGESAPEFHRLNQERARRWPGSLAAATTHDAKRSEDVRLRIDALSEVPAAWKTEAARWAGHNERHKTLLDGALEPDRDTEYFIYQTLLGCWPDDERRADGADFAERVRAYVKKSVREAKRRTDWLRPDGEYEEAVDRFLRNILSRGEDNAFLKVFSPFQRRISALGKRSALSALTLRLASPGPVDVYQGDELWNYRLTDPDNRLPVDFERRAAALAGLRRLLAEGRPRVEVVRELAARMDDGRVKMFLLREGLRLRRRAPDLFLKGAYEPLKVRGPREKHVVAFLRRRGGRVLIAAGARFFDRLPEEPGAWHGTFVALPRSFRAGSLRDAYTHRRVRPVLARGGLAIPAQELFPVIGAAMLVGGHED